MLGSSTIYNFDVFNVSSLFFGDLFKPSKCFRAYSPNNIYCSANDY